jgi:hypothetical protein
VEMLGEELLILVLYGEVDFSLMIPRIEYGHGVEGSDFTAMP